MIFDLKIIINKYWNLDLIIIIKIYIILKNLIIDLMNK